MSMVLPTAENLSLREKIAQLVFVRIGSNLPPVRHVEDDEERVAELIKECPIGGLLLFNGGPETKNALKRLQRVSKIPLLVGSDIERGVGQQVKGYTLFPHAMALGRRDASIDVFAEATAREARDVGIHVAFTPVADVATNPLNPIISIRAFSNVASRAAEITSRFVEHAERLGLLTTAKHFPGHGDTHQDSHDSLPAVAKTIDQLRACELLPFQAAIDAGCSLVMTAHVAFPSIDPSGLPATLSSTLLINVLREEMGFQGAVCSDSLLMAGVRERFSNEGEMTLAALEAGVDLLLDVREPATVVDYLVQCVDAGMLAESRVDEAYHRVLALKHKAFDPRQVEPDESTIGAYIGQRVKPRPHPGTVVAWDAIEVFDSSGPAALPFSPDRRVVAILLKPFETAIDSPEQPLAAALAERFRHTRYIQLGPNTNGPAYESAAEAAGGAEQLLIAMIVRPAAWHAFGLKPEQKRFVTNLCQTRGDVVLASLGVPYALDDFPHAAVRICTYSDVPVSQHALAEFLLRR
jgi:beta-glucosidase-like glycosyl hydrolase